MDSTSMTTGKPEDLTFEAAAYSMVPLSHGDRWVVASILAPRIGSLTLENMLSYDFRSRLRAELNERYDPDVGWYCLQVMEKVVYHHGLKIEPPAYDVDRQAKAWAYEAEQQAKREQARPEQQAKREQARQRRQQRAEIKRARRMVQQKYLNEVQAWRAQLNRITDPDPGTEHLRDVWLTFHATLDPRFDFNGAGDDMSERPWKPRTGQKIERLYAWVVEEPDGGEGIAGAIVPGTGSIASIPLIGADKARIESFREIARQVAAETGYPVRLVCYETRRDLDLITRGGDKPS